MLLGENIHECEPATVDKRIRDRLTAVLLKDWFEVKQLKLTGTAGHEEIDHTLGPRRQMPRPGR
jgi:hypothetical protein